MAVIPAHIQDRKFYFFDGSDPRHYVTAFQMNQPDLPLRVPRSGSTVVLDGGGASNFMTSYVDDVAMPFAGVPISFEILHMPEYLDLLHAVGNPLGRPTWVVGGDTWTGVATNAIGTRTDARGNAYAAVPPDDTEQRTRMISIVANNIVPPDSLTGTALICEWKGVVINTVIQGAGDGGLLMFRFEGMCYGAILTDLTAVPAGDESTPS